MPVRDAIKMLAADYASKLKSQVDMRVTEMKSDDTSHYLIYRVLGIKDQEGELIDLYQNKGRFLYQYAGSFLQDAARLCFKEKYPGSAPERIPNSEGPRPKTFQIDCVVERDAFEIKWRDATTDGDHITKEHTRLIAVKKAGYHPIRIMFYYPNRQQAVRIQQTLQTLYEGMNGEYHFGDAAWTYVTNRTGVDLLSILTELAYESA
jgi:hypothetical protein